MGAGKAVPPVNRGAASPDSICFLSDSGKLTQNSHSLGLMHSSKVHGAVYWIPKEDKWQIWGSWSPEAFMEKVAGNTGQHVRL